MTKVNLRAELSERELLIVTLSSGIASMEREQIWPPDISKAKSLVSHFNRRGTLTDAQWRLVRHLVKVYGLRGAA